MVRSFQVILSKGSGKGSLYFLLIGLILQSCFDPSPNSEGLTRSERQMLEQYFHVPGDSLDYPSPVETLFFPEEEVHGEPELDKIFLGRVLFHEKALSADGTVSCASCHMQQYAFGDHVPFSEGIEGRQTDRNTLALGSYPSLETVFQHGGFTAAVPDTFVSDIQGLYWDESTPFMYTQMEKSFSNSFEMGILVSSIPQRLAALEYYPVLFRQVYGEEELEATKAIQALLAYMATFVNIASPFDHAYAKTFMQRGNLGGDFSSFTAEQNLGKRLFTQHCASCHMVVTNIHLNSIFGIGALRACNGLETTYIDQGLGDYWGKPEWNGVFKIPSLRNIAVTAPYMHDGRFGTLGEVLEFYNTGIQAHPNLHPLLKDSMGNPIRLHLSPSELDAIEEFLHTLTNPDLINGPKWADPFR